MQNEINSINYKQMDNWIKWTNKTNYEVEEGNLKPSSQVLLLDLISNLHYLVYHQNQSVCRILNLVSTTNNYTK